MHVASHRVGPVHHTYHFLLSATTSGEFVATTNKGNFKEGITPKWNLPTNCLRFLHGFQESEETMLNVSSLDSNGTIYS